MKTKIVLWGKNENEEKILIAAELVTKKAKVKVYTFPENHVTEGFTNQMMREWRNHKEVPFPEGFQEFESELSMATSFLPENIKADRDDLIQRAQTEWQFIVLSHKLKSNFDTELEDLKEKVSELTDFDNNLWEDLKSFWNRIQHQVRDRNLFREHADNLKDKTNELFSTLKEKRREMDSKLEEKSKVFVENFNAKLEEIEKKIEDGLSLQPIFEELKNIQKTFKDASLTKQDRSKIWDRIDKTFKQVKEKRYGSVNKNKSPLERIQRRYNGLTQAIGKMEKSIYRDQDDLQFEQKRVADTQGQLEAQIRQAKVKMIEERIRSKTEKLTEMLKTKEQLEAKIDIEKRRQAAREEQERIKEAKKEIKEKIAEEIKQAAEARKELEDKIEKAANLITDNEQNESQSGTRAQEPETESLLSAAGAAISESLEDVADTISAVAKVVGDKISDAVDELTDSVEEKVKEELEDIEDNVEVNTKVEVEDLNDITEERVVEEEVEDSTENVEVKTKEAAEDLANIAVEKVEEKVEDSTKKLEAKVEEEVQDSTKKLEVKVEEEVQDLADIVEKVQEEKEISTDNVEAKVEEETKEIADIIEEKLKEKVEDLTDIVEVKEEEE